MERTKQRHLQEYILAHIERSAAISKMALGDPLKGRFIRLLAESSPNSEASALQAVSNVPWDQLVHTVIPNIDSAIGFPYITRH